MKQIGVKIKKWSIRTFMAVGAMLGLTSCLGPVECVYGPPEGADSIWVNESDDQDVEQSAQAVSGQADDDAQTNNN